MLNVCYPEIGFVHRFNMSTDILYLTILLSEMMARVYINITKRRV